MDNYSKRRYYLNRKENNNSYNLSHQAEQDKLKNLKLTQKTRYNNRYIDLNINSSDYSKNLNFLNYLKTKDNNEDLSNNSKKNKTYILSSKDNSNNLNESQNIKNNHNNKYTSPSSNNRNQNKTNINNQKLYTYIPTKKNDDKSLVKNNLFRQENNSDLTKKNNNNYIYYNEKYKNKNKNTIINNYNFNKIFLNQINDFSIEKFNIQNIFKEKKNLLITAEPKRRYRFFTHNNSEEIKKIIKIQSAWKGYFLRNIVIKSIKKYIAFIALIKYLEKIMNNNKKTIFEEIIKLLKKYINEKSIKNKYMRKTNNNNNNDEKNNNNNNRRYRNFNILNKKEKENKTQNNLFKNDYNLMNNSVEFEPLRNSFNNKNKRLSNNNKKGVTIYFINKDKESEREKEKKLILEKEKRKKEQIEREKKEQLEKEKKEKLEREKELKEKRDKIERKKLERELIEKEKRELKEREKRENELKEKREKELKERLEKMRIENEKRKKEEKEKMKNDKRINNNNKINNIGNIFYKNKFINHKNINNSNRYNNKINIDISKSTNLANLNINEDDIFNKPIKIIYVPKRINDYNNLKMKKYFNKRITRDIKNKIEKFKKLIYRKCYEKYYSFFVYQLKVLGESNFLELKINSLCNIYKLIQKKYLKKWLKIYRENVLNEKVKEVINKNMIIFNINKEKNFEKYLDNKNNHNFQKIEEINYENKYINPKNEIIINKSNFKGNEISDIILEDNNENEEEINNINDENKNEEKIILRGKRKYLPKNRLLLLTNIINRKIKIDIKNNIQILSKYFKIWNKFIKAYSDDAKPKIKINLHSPDMEIRGNKSKKKHIRVKYTKAITSKTSIGSIKSEGKSNSSSIQTKKMRIKNVVINPTEYLATTLLNNKKYSNSANIKNTKFLKLLTLMDKLDNKNLIFKCFKYWKKIKK